MNIVSNADRRLRSHLHATINVVPDRKLYLLSPQQSKDKLWRFAIYHNNSFVLLGKGVASRDVGRSVSMNRFGVKAIEYRVRQGKRIAA